MSPKPSRYRGMFNICVFLVLAAILGVAWVDVAISFGKKYRANAEAARKRAETTAAAATAKAGVTNPAAPPPPALQVQGVMGTARRRLVIINGQQFEQGAEHTLEVRGREMRVRCVEIGEQTVTLSAGGTNVVLSLKEE